MGTLKFTIAITKKARRKSAQKEKRRDILVFEEL